MEGRITNEGKVSWNSSHIPVNIDKLTLKQILWKSITEVLSLLGQSTMQNVMWQLSQRGIHFNSEEFNIRQLGDTLEELFGDGADVLLDLIYYKLDRRLSQLGPVPTLKRNLPAVEKILILIEKKKLE